MSNILTGNLNTVQQDAVQAEDGPVLVLAGPGSGKTRVLTHRVTHLIQERGVNPFSILAVTFTNKAAREMKERLIGMVGEEQAAALTMGTFHSICARFLRRSIEHLGRNRDFVIYDADDQERLMRQAIRQLNIDEKQNTPRNVLSRISSAKNRLITPEQFALDTSKSINLRDKIDTLCYQQYQKLLLQNNALDFDDLLMITVRLFQEHPDVLDWYHQRYIYILVDEYQDTNHAQYSLVNLLAAKQRQLFVVGDDDQAIYAWRGADRENILRFERDYPEAKIFVLEQNYRSTQAILDVAQAIIRGDKKHKHKKKLWTENEYGEQVVLAEAYDANDEAFQVVGEIRRLINSQDYQTSDIAIMYRTNAQSRAFEETFVSYGMPYRIVGGMRFYDRKEIRDVMAYLRFLFNPTDGVSLERIINVPKRNIGDQTLRILQGWANEQGVSIYQAIRMIAAEETIQVPIATRGRNSLMRFFDLTEELLAARQRLSLPDLVSHLFSAIGFRKALLEEYGEDEGEERWQNIQELHRVTFQYAGLSQEIQLPTFLEESALYTDLDKMESQTNAVTCITLHQAKGLEFPVVFLVGLEDGLLPHSRSTDDTEKLEEERRLFYVGVTRACKLLYLIYATRRGMMYGEETRTIRSRFFKYLPGDLLLYGMNRPKIVKPAPVTQSAKITTVVPGAVKREAEKPEEKKKPSGEKREKATRTRTASQTGSKRKASGKILAVFNTSNSRYRPGQQVRHENYGEGVIVSCRTITGDEEVVVHFLEHGQKTLLASFSHLELIEQKK